MAGDVEVVVATNAYADGLVPWLRRRVVPVGSFIDVKDVTGLRGTGSVRATL